MSFYDRYVLPKVLDWSCGTKPVRRQRQKVVPLAAGRVPSLPIAPVAE